MNGLGLNTSRDKRFIPLPKALQSDDWEDITPGEDEWEEITEEEAQRGIKSVSQISPKAP